MTITTTPYPEDRSPSFASVLLGIDAHGNPISIDLLWSNCLIGGTPGAGKSGGITTILAGIAALPNVALIGLDPKGAELNLWRERFTTIAESAEEASLFLTELCDEIDLRYQWLEEKGLKKVSEREISPEMPLIVLIIEEVADLVACGTTEEEKAADAERSGLIRRLVAMGRAAGIVVIAATQKPQSNVIPSELRDLFRQRIAYAMTDKAMTQNILGAEVVKKGALAHDISPEDRGVFYIVGAESGKPVLGRTCWVPDEDAASIASKTAHLRWEPSGSSARLPLGLDSGDNPVFVDLSRGSLLIEGEIEDMTDVVTTLIAEASSKENTAIICVMQRLHGHDLPPGTRVSYAPGAGEEAITADALEALVAEIERRTSSPDTTAPNIFLFIDDLELLVRSGSSRVRERITAALKSIVRDGSRVGIRTVAFYWQLRKPLRLEYEFAHRLTLRPLVSPHAMHTLGASAAISGTPELFEPLTERFEGFLCSDGDDAPRRVFLHVMCDEHKHLAGLNFSHLRVELPWLEEIARRAESLRVRLGLVAFGVVLVGIVALSHLFAWGISISGILPDWLL